MEPVGLHGAWNAAAEKKLLECLTKPKRVVTPKQHVSSLPATAPAVTLICISRKRSVFLATPLPTKQRRMHDPTKVLQLEDGKVSSSSSSSDSTSDSSSSTSSDEEAVQEHVPNPSLPPPPENPSTPGSADG